MEVEIELKLSTKVQAGPIIVEKLLPLLKVKVEQSEVELTNSYFDTPKRDFRKNNMGLRIRGCQHQFEQTLKTAGKGVAGLQQRPEYNISLGISKQNVPEKPTLALFPIDVWPRDFDVVAAQQGLICQFSTHFTRTIYLLTWPDTTQVEIVWDRGEVLASSRSSTISEIELELKKGSVDILFSLAKQLAEIMPVTIGLLSKAARGYRLMDDAKSEHQVPSKSPNVMFNEEDFRQADEGVLRIYMTKTLKQWQNMSLCLPIEHHEFVKWGQNLIGVLVFIDKTVRKLQHHQPKRNLQISLSHLDQLQQRASERLEKLVAVDLKGLQASEAEQSLLALSSDKQAIILQLEMMQWLSSIE